MRSSCHKNKTGSLKLPHLFSPHSSRTSSQPIWSCQSITKGNRKKRKKKKGNIQTPKNDAKRDHQTTKQKHIHLGIAKNLRMRSSCHEKTQDHKNLLIFSTLIALEHHLNQLGVVKSITRGKPVAPEKKKAPKLPSFVCKKKSTTSLTPSFLSFFLSFFLLEPNKSTDPLCSSCLFLRTLLLLRHHFLCNTVINTPKKQNKTTTTLMRVQESLQLNQHKQKK
jgi:hypothetical protein